MLPLLISLAFHTWLIALADGWVVEFDGYCPCHAWHNRIFVSSDELVARKARARLQPQPSFVHRVVASTRSLASVGSSAAR